MADNVIRVNVTTVAPKSVTIQGSKEQNYINATGDTSGYNAQLAKNWAIGEGKIQGIDYSSKHYAGVAKEKAELSSESLNNVQEIVAGFGETAGNATNELAHVKNDAVIEISNLNTSVIEGIETASNGAIAEIEGARTSAVADVATNKNTAINEIKTKGNTAISSIEAKGQEQIKNIEKTGFFMENDKLFFINSEGEVEEFSSGGGTLNMFDTVLKDHILTYEETKGLALQGTYVYKEAIAGSRYGYSTFYEKCLEEFQNASNTKEYLSSNVNLVGSLVDTKGVLSGFSTTNYATLPNTFAPTSSDTWEMVVKFTARSIGTLQNVFAPPTNGYSALVNITTAGKAIMYLSSNGTGWNLATDKTGTTVFVANQTYYLKLAFDGAQYILSSSTDGAIWTQEIAVTSTTSISSTAMVLGLRATSPLLGTIDLNGSYININGSRWWTGVDTITKNPNGHLFYDIKNKKLVDEIYNSTGRAWFYGVDTENERIFLPRNSKYFRIGDETTVGTNQDAGLPNITGSLLNTYDGNASGQSGAFYNSSIAANNGFGFDGNSHTTANATRFSASRSSALYGKTTNTVELDSVNMLLYICVGNTESEKALTNVTEITTSENDTLPWGYHFYSGELLEAPIGYIESLGQWNDGSGLYAQFFSKAVNKLGEAFAGGYIKEVTGEYDDYDLVINQTDMTFRLPLLDGSEDLSGDRVENLTLLASGSTYIAPANGWFQVVKGSTATAQYLDMQNLNTILWEDKIAGSASDTIRGKLFANKGDAVTINYNLGGTTWSFRFIYAQGNGSLYFKVANAVQNLELLNAGEVLEAVNDINAKVDNTVRVVETYQNGTSWYRVYSDGWCEQGGQVTGASYNATTKNVTFLKPFLNTNYFATATPITGEHFCDSAWVQYKTTTAMTVKTGFQGSSAMNTLSNWEAKGYIA